MMSAISEKLTKVLPRVISFKKLVNKTNNIAIPLYHCVSNRENIFHLKHLYPVRNVSSFLTDLDFLLKHYNPIELTEIEDIAFKRKRLTHPAVLLTFDDGLKECHEVISPILQQKGLPAIFFINSAFVGNRDLFYRYKVSLIIEEILNDSAKFKLLSNGKDLGKVMIFLKSLNYNDISLIDGFAKKIGLSFEDYLKKEKPYMDEAQINSLLKSGFHIGSHSVNHPNYNHINFETQLSQTINSTNYVTDTFGVDYRLFAFPFTDNGVSSNFFEQIIGNHCDVTFGTSGSRTDRIEGSLQRIPFEIGNLSAKEIMTKYLVARSIRKMNGTFYIDRKDANA